MRTMKYNTHLKYDGVDFRFVRFSRALRSLCLCIFRFFVSSSSPSAFCCFFFDSMCVALYLTYFEFFSEKRYYTRNVDSLSSRSLPSTSLSFFSCYYVHVAHALSVLGYHFFRSSTLINRVAMMVVAVAAAATTIIIKEKTKKTKTHTSIARAHIHTRFFSLVPQIANSVFPSLGKQQKRNSQIL